MLPYLLAAALAAAPACPDPTLGNPVLKVVRANQRAFDDYIVTVNVTNGGKTAQNAGVRQHLLLVQGDQTLGSQPVPALGAGDSYVAAFRIRRPHARKRAPLPVAFRYVLDDTAQAGRENCNAANDQLDAKL